MPFKPGKSGNPDGRPVGTVSLKTQQWEQMAEFVLSDALPAYKANLMEQLTSPDAGERNEGMRHLENVLEYFKPKLARTEVTGKDGQEFSINVIQVGGDGKKTQILKAI